MEDKINVNIGSMKSIFVSAMFNDQIIANATGFIVNESNYKFLITNRHVVTGRHNITGKCLDGINAAIPNKLKIWFPYYKDNKYIWSPIIYDLFDENENKKWLEHPLYNEKVDVVALPLGVHSDNMFSYNMNSNYDSYVTEDVFIIGYPYGYDVSPNNGKYAIWSKGTIANDPDLDLNIYGNQLPAFLIDSKTREGQSGSPVIYYSRHGFVEENGGFAVYGSPIIHELGIYSGRINDESDLGYVWKWCVIREIVKGSVDSN